jgi:ABC-type dipeptide/oligopeptide/nickel transport system permease component
MNALIRAELLKLGSTRTTRLLVLGGLAIAALLGTATATTAGKEASAALGSAESTANIVGVSAMPGFFMLIVGVLAMAGEYQHLPAPHRHRGDQPRQRHHRRPPPGHGSTLCCWAGAST